MRDLVASGAAVDAREDRFGGTALGWALHGSMHSGGSRDADYLLVADALIDAGAALPEIVDDTRFSPAILAAIRPARTT